VFRLHSACKARACWSCRAGCRPRLHSSQLLSVILPGTVGDCPPSPDAFFEAHPSVRLSVRIPLVQAVSGWFLLTVASVIPVQRLYGPLRNPPSTYGKEKVYGSIP
jgi:hypothetical protein